MIAAMAARHQNAQNLHIFRTFAKYRGYSYFFLQTAPGAKTGGTFSEDYKAIDSGHYSEC
jgi:hypothetical protein